MDDEFAPVLLILPTPDELGIEVSVARILDRAGAGIVLIEHGLVLSSGDDLPLRLVVGEGLDRLGSGGLFGHCYWEICQSPGSRLVRKS